jgi:hypothetical protein
LPGKEKKGRKMDPYFDDQFHHITFALDENETLIVLLDGVKIEGNDKELAMKVFEHVIWFKYQPLPSVIEPKKGRNRKR